MLPDQPNMLPFETRGPCWWGCRDPCAEVGLQVFGPRRDAIVNDLQATSALLLRFPKVVLGHEVEHVFPHSARWIEKDLQLLINIQVQDRGMAGTSRQPVSLEPDDKHKTVATCMQATSYSGGIQSQPMLHGMHVTVKFKDGNVCTLTKCSQYPVLNVHRIVQPSALEGSWVGAAVYVGQIQDIICDTILCGSGLQVPLSLPCMFVCSLPFFTGWFRADSVFTRCASHFFWLI